MNVENKQRDGAALIIVLGFLSILTITILAFAMQVRSERLAGRAYTAKAQTRHLLHAALTRAMEDIDNNTSSNYPEFFVIGSQGESRQRIATSINFDSEEEFFTVNNALIKADYETERKNATWQTVRSNSGELGRVGYLIINSSGLLDANHAGGTSSLDDFTARESGTSVEEIQLSVALLNELDSSSPAQAYPHIDADNPAGTLRSAVNPDLSPAFAFVYNRSNAWSRFETVRDIYSLNQIGEPDIITAPIENFSTFSFSPPQADERTFMGTNSATLATEFIEDELDRIGMATHSTFVMNQLRDYLDEDTFPEDENGEYTDLSVEPVPLINELVLTFDFTFTPVYADDQDLELEVASVIVSNSYSLEAEVWYPFVGYETPDTFSVNIAEAPNFSSDISGDNILSGVTNWIGSFVVTPADFLSDERTPFGITIFEDGLITEVNSANELVDLFTILQNDISFSSLLCSNISQGQLVDRVLNLELPMENAVTNDLIPDLMDLATELFDGIYAQTIENQLVVGMACIDPRLNWDGESLNQWKQQIEFSDVASFSTMGAENIGVIADNAVTPDDTDKIYVRNADQIDSPWEFTYFLYDENKPWKTFQMLEVNDDDDTRKILERLSPYPNSPPLHGRINPHSPHENVIASAFLNIPLDEYSGEPEKRLDTTDAIHAAELFINYYSQNPWPATPADYGTNIFTSVIEDLNTWEQEGFLRNSFELFNPRDTLYTILIVAQSGSDTDSNGLISDDEVQGSQKAVVYIWRDPITGEATCIFYGLSDTLRNANDRSKWTDLLNAFNPDASP